MKTADARKLYISALKSILKPGPGVQVTGKRGIRAVLNAVMKYPVGQLNEPDDNVLVWSDLHLGHDNIIEYTNRPFLDTDDMNQTLWANLEDAVRPDKVVVVVGDMAMGPALNEATWQRLRALDCRRRHLVVGNHDLTGAGLLRADGFDSYWSVLVSNGAPPLIWTHYPLASVPDGYVNIHGHVHDDPPGRSPHINVSVEQLDYNPVPLADLRALANVLINGMYPAGNTTLERLRSIGHSP